MHLPPSDSLVFVQDQELYNDRALYINDADWEMCSICLRVPTDYLMLGDQFIHTLHFLWLRMQQQQSNVMNPSQSGFLLINKNK